MKKIKKKEAPVLKSPENILRAAAYVFSFLNPVIGFIICVVFYPQQNKDASDFGKNCIILSLIGLALGIFVFIGMLVSGVMFMDMPALPGIETGEGYY